LRQTARHNIFLVIFSHSSKSNPLSFEFLRFLCSFYFFLFTHTHPIFLLLLLLLLLLLSQAHLLQLAKCFCQYINVISECRCRFHVVYMTDLLYASDSVFERILAFVLGFIKTFDIINYDSFQNFSIRLSYYSVIQLSLSLYCILSLQISTDLG